MPQTHCKDGQKIKTENKKPPLLQWGSGEPSISIKKKKNEGCMNGERGIQKAKRQKQVGEKSFSLQIDHSKIIRPVMKLNNMKTHQQNQYTPPCGNEVTFTEYSGKNFRVAVGNAANQTHASVHIRQA